MISYIFRVPLLSVGLLLLTLPMVSSEKREEEEKSHAANQTLLKGEEAPKTIEPPSKQFVDLKRPQLKRSQRSTSVISSRSESSSPLKISSPSSSLKSPKKKPGISLDLSKVTCSSNLPQDNPGRRSSLPTCLSQSASSPHLKALTQNSPRLNSPRFRSSSVSSSPLPEGGIIEKLTESMQSMQNMQKWLTPRKNWDPQWNDKEIESTFQKWGTAGRTFATIVDLWKREFYLGYTKDLPEGPSFSRNDKGKGAISGIFCYKDIWGINNLTTLNVGTDSLELVTAAGLFFMKKIGCVQPLCQEVIQSYRTLLTREDIKQQKKQEYHYYLAECLASMKESETDEQAWEYLYKIIPYLSEKNADFEWIIRLKDDLLRKTESIESIESIEIIESIESIESLDEYLARMGGNEFDAQTRKYLYEALPFLNGGNSDVEWITELKDRLLTRVEDIKNLPHKGKRYFEIGHVEEQILKNDIEDDSSYTSGTDSLDFSILESKEQTYHEPSFIALYFKGLNCFYQSPQGIGLAVSKKIRRWFPDALFPFFCKAYHCAIEEEDEQASIRYLTMAQDFFKHLTKVGPISCYDYGSIVEIFLKSVFTQERSYLLRNSQAHLFAEVGKAIWEQQPAEAKQLYIRATELLYGVDLQSVHGFEWKHTILVELIKEMIHPDFSAFDHVICHKAIVDFCKNLAHEEYVSSLYLSVARYFKEKNMYVSAYNVLHQYFMPFEEEREFERFMEEEEGYRKEIEGGISLNFRLGLKEFYVSTNNVFFEYPLEIIPIENKQEFKELNEEISVFYKEVQREKENLRSKFNHMVNLIAENNQFSSIEREKHGNAGELEKYENDCITEYLITQAQRDHLIHSSRTIDWNFVKKRMNYMVQQGNYNYSFRKKEKEDFMNVIYELLGFPKELWGLPEGWQLS